MKFRFGEINVVCTDRDRSLAFYRNVLGFEVLEEEGSAVHMRGAGVAFLILPVAREAPPPGNPYPSQATLSFDLVVEDLEAARSYFRDHGVDYEDREGFFLIRDPDGLPIEIVQAE